MRILPLGISSFVIALLGNHLASEALGAELTDPAGLEDRALEEEVRISTGVFVLELTVGDLERMTRFMVPDPMIDNLSGLEPVPISPNLSQSET